MTTEPHGRIGIGRPAPSNVALGKPVVKGTRITVELILEKLGVGESVQDLRLAHPRLTLEGIRAAFLHAAEVLRCDIVRPSGDHAA